MIDEREEFAAYTGAVQYTAKNKQDTTWMGRFFLDMLLDFEGFGHILTVLARGYMYEGDRPDTARARRALCAWCSVPEKKKASPKKDWQFDVCFPVLHEEFPELVDINGVGWLCRHVRRLCAFAKQHPDLLSKPNEEKIEQINKGWENEWRNKVVQYQTPIFTPTTKGAWATRFDDVIADALELGPLQSPDIPLSDDMEQRISEATPKGMPVEVLRALVRYYIAHRQEDTDWVVLPVVNFDAWFGPSFGKKWLYAIPEDLIVRQGGKNRGVCRYIVKM